MTLARILHKDDRERFGRIPFTQNVIILRNDARY
jgi:hypothetical protein